MKFASLTDLFFELAPAYKGHSWRDFVVDFPWDRSIADDMEELKPKACQKRRDTYLIPGGIDPDLEHIKFGNFKDGYGFRGKRKNFCLLAGCLRYKKLTLFYRRLELIRGLHFDTVLFREVEDVMGKINRIHIMARQADIYAPRGSSNEKFYYEIRRYHEGRRKSGNKKGH